MGPIKQAGIGTIKNPTLSRSDFGDSERSDIFLDGTYNPRHSMNVDIHRRDHQNWLNDHKDLMGRKTYALKAKFY